MISGNGDHIYKGVCVCMCVCVCVCVSLCCLPSSICSSIRMIPPGNLLTILYELTKSEASNCNGFRDLSLLCKLAKGNNP